MDYLEVLRTFIIENFLFGDANGLSEDTSFLESGIVDSTGMLEIVSFLETKFGINVDDDELIPENFDCLAKLNAYLVKKHNDQVMQAVCEAD
jgi:acyl carrier protein